MFDWNDIRYLLAMADHGSTMAAARALGVNQSTVLRRLAELEKALGDALIARQPAGYVLTSFAHGLMPAARQVSSEAAGLLSQAEALRRDSRGLIRVTCPEPIIPRLKPLLDRFQDLHPAFRIEFVTSDRYLDLRQGEAEVAFRSGDTDDDLIGRKIAESVWAVYASTGYIERHGRPLGIEDLVHHNLVTLDSSMAKHRVVLWLDTVAPHAHIAGRHNSVLGMINAVSAGVGVGPLPANIADAHLDLVQVIPPVAALQRTWRLLTTPTLRRTPRVNAFFNFILSEREAVKAILN